MRRYTWLFLFTCTASRATKEEKAHSAKRHVLLSAEKITVWAKIKRRLGIGWNKGSNKRMKRQGCCHTRLWVFIRQNQMSRLWIEKANIFYNFNDYKLPSCTPVILLKISLSWARKGKESHMGTFYTVALCIFIFWLDPPSTPGIRVMLLLFLFHRGN